MASNTTIECGAEAAKEFLFDEGYTNLNHGSYGTYPRAVQSVFRHWEDRTEARPDAFIRYEYRTHLLDESRSAIAQYLQAPVDCCVFVRNASTGIDTILLNFAFNPGDVVICFTTIYDGFVNTLEYIRETASVEVRKVDYKLPVSDDYICDEFENCVKSIKAEGKVPRIAIFDTVSSELGACMPFERLTRLCRLHNVLSWIDGAHGVGHIPLNLSTLDPDFFVSNCHKWLTTIPVSFGFVSLAQQKKNASNDTNFVANFAYVATADDNPYLCIKAALAWRSRLKYNNKIGEAAAIDYMRDLAREGGQLVSKILGTQVLENKQGTLGQCSFANVRLPVPCKELVGEDEDTGRILLLKKWIMKTMTIEHNTAVYIFRLGDTLWIRLSAQVYLALSDFEAAAHKLKQTCERAIKGGWKQ